jgi:histidinol-phosphate aminotransferase
MSVQIAQQALRLDDRLKTRQDTIEIVAERNLLAAELVKFPWVEQVHASVTNFILIQVRNADALMQHCIAQDVLIRNQSSQLGLSQAIRITVGNPEENIELLRVLASFQPATEELA